VIDIDDQIQQWASVDGDALQRVSRAVFGGEHLSVTLGPV
jgi:hypothetical protein